MVNLAEQGNPTLRHQHTLILVDAGNDDVTTVLIQDRYKQLVDNVRALSGVGPNQALRAYDC